MNKKLLCAALLTGLGLAGAASAQTFDNRWYVSGSVGVNVQDEDRGTEDSPFATLGFGKFLNPNLSLDAELNYPVSYTHLPSPRDYAASRMPSSA